MKKLVLAFLALIVLLGLYFFLSPSKVQPLAYDPPAKPEISGVLAPNDKLTRAELLGLGQVHGPEDIALAGDGAVYCGCADGAIRIIGTDGRVSTFAETGGRPLGMVFDRDDNLIVCDAVKGLLSVDPKGHITVLATQADGVPFKFTDDLDIASDGRIYFTDASMLYGIDEYLYDLLAHRPLGRFLVYDPESKKVKVLLKDLYFANGVALSQKEDFVLVNETYAYRIKRYWLRGPKAGTSEIFIENLPGFPDNISSNRRGTFWLAMYTVRNDIMDRIHPSPLLKTVLSKLPRFLWPKPQPYGLVLALDESGAIRESLHDPTGEHLKVITSAKEWNGFLYLGSLHNDRVGKYRLSSAR